MINNLYSELRTIYETTAEDPHTFRITIKLKDIIDGELFRRAVEKTMLRYPYFRVRMTLEGSKPCFEANTEPVPVIHTNRRTILGSQQTSGHLICFCYWQNEIHIDVYHAMTDGGGIAPLLKTLLHYYCASFYETGLSEEGIRLSGDPVPQLEWDDPAAKPLGTVRKGMARKWSDPALQLEGAGIARMIPDSISFNMRIPEEAFMRFNISNDGSPATIVALFLARAIAELHPAAALPPVIAMCVNQRKALRAPLAHQSLVGDVRLPYTDRLKRMPFSTQATCFRGMVALQSDEDMVLDEIRDYQEIIKRLETMADTQARKAFCVHRMEELSKCFTATVSYVGKADLGGGERFIIQYNAIPSTALPSTHVPLTVELSAVNGYFFLNFIQFFEEDDYFLTFARQLRQNGIDYDVLDVIEARYPRVVLPL